MKTQNQTSGGIGFFGLLALIFICLKLAGVGVVADWSWWWVLSPLWLPLAVVLAIIGAIWVFYAATRGRAR